VRECVVDLHAVRGRNIETITGHKLVGVAIKYQQ